MLILMRVNEFYCLPKKERPSVSNCSLVLPDFSWTPDLLDHQEGPNLLSSLLLLSIHCSRHSRVNFILLTSEETIAVPALRSINHRCATWHPSPTAFLNRRPWINIRMKPSCLSNDDSYRTSACYSGEMQTPGHSSGFIFDLLRQ